MSILLGYQEPGWQLPELDILLPRTLTVNCLGRGLYPTVPASDAPHVLDAIQLVIPIDCLPEGGEES